MQDLVYHGNIDLVILSFSLPHMLPDRDKNADSWTREEVGQILSYRPASRGGDDVVIWRLLVAGTAFDSPEILWRSKLHISGDMVQTGFLMSSTPRSSAKRFSWAPSTPYFKPRKEQPTRTATPFRAFRGAETMPGIITDKGLLAAWHVFEFEATISDRSDNDEGGPRGSQIALLKEISGSYLCNSTRGALLIPMSNISTFERDRDNTTRYNGLIKGNLVAVLGCNRLSVPPKKTADHRGWTWKGVYEWNENVPLPEFRVEDNFLIE